MLCGGEQELEEDAGARGAADGGRGVDDERGEWGRGRRWHKQRGNMRCQREFAGGGQPVFGEGGLKVGDGAAFDASMVSRQTGIVPTPLNHWSAMPAPPMKPMLPSTMRSSRCVRLSSCRRRYQVGEL